MEKPATAWRPGLPNASRRATLVAAFRPLMDARRASELLGVPASWVLAEARADRRYKQLKEKGIDANLRALSRDLRDRDERDARRAVAPLVPAPDSQVLDSSALSIDEVVDRIVGWSREKKLGGQD